MLSSMAAAHLQDKMMTAAKENGGENGDSGEIDTSDVPDDDAIKMFVGQVPRSMDEDALKSAAQCRDHLFNLPSSGRHDE